MNFNMNSNLNPLSRFRRFFSGKPLHATSVTSFIKGTLILTAAGLLSRLIGFFYRIYLSRCFGEENIGIYQLITPVISLGFSLCAAGYQTAVSKLAAEAAAGCASPYSAQSRKPLYASLLISLPLSLLCTFLTYTLADPIGVILLKEPRTVILLKIIAFSFPFVGIHACINGWFYGMKKAGLPSAAQLIEQLTRVACVYLITRKAILAGRLPDISAAVFGLTIGELISMTVAIVTFLPYCDHPTYEAEASGERNPKKSTQVSFLALLPSLLSTALPLTANRLVINLLGSAESVAIPEMLRRFGYDTETALSVFGVLTGMALPLIFFPNALTGSVAVMLLPMISENCCLQKYHTVKRLTFRTLKYCLLMGFGCLLVFTLGGPFLGKILFHSTLAGRCIRTLGFICPFLYLDTTLSGILQGIGKSGVLFLVNIFCLLTRLAFVYLAVPFFGLQGYLWGMLTGQLLLTALYLLCLHRFFKALPAVST